TYESAMGVLRVIPLVILGALAWAPDLLAQQHKADAQAQARSVFETRCGRCHGADGNGGEMGPSLPARLVRLDDKQLATLIRDGRPAKGMPPNPMPPARTASLIRLLREFQRHAEERPAVRMTAQLVDGASLEGLVLGEGFEDVQLRT